MTAGSTDERPGTAPRVSIVVPAYNREQYLGRTLDSVIAQTVTDWELIVSDDGSTDATAEVAATYARADPRIRVISAPNGGVAAARNRGLAVIDGRSEFVVLLDSDDRWLPDSLEAMIGALEDRPDLVSVYGLARCIDSDDQPVPDDDLEDRMRERFEYRGRHLAAVAPHEPTTFAAMMFHNYPITPGLHLVRRRVIDQVGTFDTQTDPADDWDMVIRISRLGPIGFLDRVVLQWRRHPETLTGTSPRWRKAFYSVRAKTLTAPDNTPEQRRLARIAYLAASREAFARGWSHLRGRQPRSAARDVAGGIDIALQYARAAVPLLTRRIRRAPETVGPT